MAALDRCTGNEPCCFMPCPGSTDARPAEVLRDQDSTSVSRACYECHSEKSEEVGGKLLLDSREAIRRGGQTGPAVVPGKPASSLLLIAMNHSDSKLIMPPADYGF